jgi:hypothetical protein
LQWLQAGGIAVYNAGFQTAIGGYPNNAIIQSAVTPGLLWQSTADSNMSNPDAGGSNWTTVLPYTYRWDNGVSPPVSDVFLRPGDKAAISFSAATNIPLHISTVQPAFYRISVATFASNTTNADIYLYPNNVSHVGAFNCWETAHIDQVLTALGTATTPEVRSTITNFTNFPGNISQIPIAAFGPGNTVQNGFSFDLFYGPATGDTSNDIGPWVLDILCCTATIAKIASGRGGIQGGPSSHFGKWTDTTTPWASLGTILDGSGTSMSGLAVVERLN